MFYEPEKITDKDEILEACRKIMGKKAFLYRLHDKKENLNYEAAGILTIVTGDEGVRLTLTNSDVNYSSAIGFVMLDDVEYIQEDES